MATATQTVPSRSLPTYQQARESKHERRLVESICDTIPTFAVDWADLVTLDLRQFDEPDGKQKLAQQLADAVHNVGVFYVKHRSSPTMATSDTYPDHRLSPNARRNRPPIRYRKGPLLPPRLRKTPPSRKPRTRPLLRLPTQGHYRTLPRPA